MTADAEKGPSEADEPEAPAPGELLTEATWAYRVGRLCCRLELGLLHRLQVEGREHVPAEGGFLVVCNHQSFLDIPIVAAALSRRHVSFVARETLANFAPLAWLMRRCGAVLIRRGVADRRALNEMIEHLRAGDVVCVFPEGTRSPDGRLGTFLPGALFAARRARVPILPAGIRGACDAMPRDAKLPRPRRVGIRFGEPIDGQRKDAMDVARERIAGMIGNGKFGNIPGS